MSVMLTYERILLIAVSVIPEERCRVTGPLPWIREQGSHFDAIFVREPVIAWLPGVIRFVFVKLTPAREPV